jgi:hypothetical protein
MAKFSVPLQITPDERASQLWGQTLKETFLDGYNGVK